MRTKKTFAPNAGESIGGNTEVPVTKSQSKRNVPTKDHDFGQLCTTVGEKWKEMPAFTLLYITQSGFATMAANYSGDLSMRQSTGGKRPVITGELVMADKLINKGIRKIKLYLKDKYDEAATNYYASFGMEQKRKAYRFPDDRNKRLDALQLIIKSVETEGFDDKAFGSSFWSSMYEQYKLLLGKASVADGTVSKKVGSKKVLKEALEEVLNSLIFLIKANYPNNWKAELRNWGFQKEKY